MQNPLAPRKTVASVMATFTKTITDLTTVADNSDSIVSNLQVEQERIAADMAEARTEAEAARAIRSKLEDLIQA